MKCKKCKNKIGIIKSLFGFTLCEKHQVMFDNTIRYVVYLGGTPIYFNTRKKRDAYWNKMKTTKRYRFDGNQDRSNYKNCMWKRVFKGYDISE